MAVLQQWSGFSSLPAFLLRANNIRLVYKPDCEIVLLAIHKTNNGVQVDTLRPGDTQVPR